MKEILDVCCGARMFWYERNHYAAFFMDNREEELTLCDGRKLEIAPDIKADFRKNPFPDESFSLVVFDPPHLINAGEKSWLRAKYGVLNKETWREDLRIGFSECWRVLKDKGVLVFKWSEDQIPFKEIELLFPDRPLFGDRRGKTRWTVFMKGI
nr:MAG TPA: Methyltransferase domain [Caudoviricetes sp.]